MRRLNQLNATHFNSMRVSRIFDWSSRICDWTSTVDLNAAFYMCRIELKLSWIIYVCSNGNRPFPSSLVPLFQSESTCETILMKITLICMKMKLRAELIFIWKVSHLDSFWDRGTRELRSGLFKTCHSPSALFDKTMRRLNQISRTYSFESTKISIWFGTCKMRRLNQALLPTHFTTLNQTTRDRPLDDSSLQTTRPWSSDLVVDKRTKNNLYDVTLRLKSFRSILRSLRCKKYSRRLFLVLFTAFLDYFWRGNFPCIGSEVTSLAIRWNKVTMERSDCKALKHSACLPGLERNFWT